MIGGGGIRRILRSPAKGGIGDFFGFQGESNILYWFQINQTAIQIIRSEIQIFLREESFIFLLNSYQMIRTENNKNQTEKKII